IQVVRLELADREVVRPHPGVLALAHELRRERRIELLSLVPGEVRVLEVIQVRVGLPRDEVTLRVGRVFLDRLLGALERLFVEGALLFVGTPQHRERDLLLGVASEPGVLGPNAGRTRAARAARRARSDDRTQGQSEDDTGEAVHPGTSSLTVNTNCAFIQTQVFNRATHRRARARGARRTERRRALSRHGPRPRTRA